MIVTLKGTQLYIDEMPVSPDTVKALADAAWRDHHKLWSAWTEQAIAAADAFDAANPERTYDESGHRCLPVSA